MAWHCMNLPAPALQGEQGHPELDGQHTGGGGRAVDTQICTAGAADRDTLHANTLCTEISPASTHERFFLEDVSNMYTCVLCTIIGKYHNMYTLFFASLKKQPFRVSQQKARYHQVVRFATKLNLN